MKILRLFPGIASAALLLALSVPGFGGTIANGSFGFNSTGGLITYTPNGSILNASTITIPTPNASSGCGVAMNVCEQITSIPPTYLTLQNDFAAGGNTPLHVNDDVTFSSYTFDLTLVALPVFHFTGQNSDRFTFTATGGLKNTASLANSDFLNLAYSGMFSDSLGFYNTAPGSLSLTFTQSGGATGAVTYSGTFATPPLPTSGVPEPETMAMVGGALIGLGMLGRKRLARR
ncbi:MAG: PEP-CTERM sorting domain-containing protein [Acidobacteria bacterium]|nr:PEP-CTERM sorting domain-containing protein [Acidobacteriota bacterium]